MRGRRPTLSPLLLAVSDTVAIIVFVTIGLLSHKHGLSLRGYARDALPILAGWFAAAAWFHPYRDRRVSRSLATWAVGIPAGVLLRALVLGRTLNGKEGAFLGVTLVTVLLLVIALRTAITLLARPAHPAAP